VVVVDCGNQALGISDVEDGYRPSAGNDNLVRMSKGLPGFDKVLPTGVTCDVVPVFNGRLGFRVSLGCFQ
jgi:hypothetical protein